MPIRRRRYANERVAVLLALGAASFLACFLELFRELRYDDAQLRFILWNLMLAWIPLLLALLVYDRYRAGTPLLGLAPWAFLWLLFLPNAPYTMTDFVHLSAGGPSPLWLDGAVLSTFGWTGMLLGFVSIYLLHAVVRHRFGVTPSWCFVGAVLALGSAGVCVGRFLRWNSWDVLVRPGQRLGELSGHLGDPGAVARAAVLTLLLTCLLGATYFTFYALVGIRLEPDRRLPATPRRPHRSRG
jgi:uncharacterized membrane protein